MTEITSAEIKAQTALLFADNTTGEISAGDLRTQMDNLADSAAIKTTGRIVPPTANDDGANTSGNGVFNVGDIWLDEVADTAWLCLDNSTTVAVWIDITQTTANVLTSAEGPAANELAVWTGATTLKGETDLIWDGTSLSIGGDLVLTGTVDGRDIAVDGAKLDTIANNAISGISIGNENVDGTSTGYNKITKFTFITGDGITVTNPVAGEIEITPAFNKITKDIASRTLTATDNNSHITNTGATGTVRWTVPTGLTKLKTTFFKTANQTMEIIGANSVTINGATESGGNESLKTICSSQYNSFVTLVRTGTNTYNLYNGAVDRVGTTVNNQLAIWTGDGILEGDSNIQWTGTALNVTGEVASNWTFNAQTGTAYTLVLTDRSRIITMANAAANTLTIPTNATVALPIGTEIRVIQIDAGATTITADVGVTLNGVAAGSGTITAQWDEIRLYKVATDTWYATGAIGAVA